MQGMRRGLLKSSEFKDMALEDAKSSDRDGAEEI